MHGEESLVTDPICGMSVDKATALHAEREGEKTYFCGEGCRQKFLAMPADERPKASGGCCG